MGSFEMLVVLLALIMGVFCQTTLDTEAPLAETLLKADKSDEDKDEDKVKDNDGLCPLLISAGKTDECTDDSTCGGKKCCKQGFSKVCHTSVVFAPTGLPPFPLKSYTLDDVYVIDPTTLRDHVINNLPSVPAAISTQISAEVDDQVRELSDSISALVDALAGGMVTEEDLSGWKSDLLEKATERAAEIKEELDEDSADFQEAITKRESKKTKAIESRNSKEIVELYRDYRKSQYSQELDEAKLMKHIMKYLSAEAKASAASTVSHIIFLQGQIRISPDLETPLEYIASYTQLLRDHLIAHLTHEYHVSVIDEAIDIYKDERDEELDALDYLASSFKKNKQDFDKLYEQFSENRDRIKEEIENRIDQFASGLDSHGGVDIHATTEFVKVVFRDLVLSGDGNSAEKKEGIIQELVVLLVASGADAQQLTFEDGDTVVVHSDSDQSEEAKHQATDTYTFTATVSSNVSPGLSGGAIAGIVIAGVFCVLLAGVLVFLLVQNKRGIETV